MCNIRSFSSLNDVLNEDYAVDMLGLKFKVPCGLNFVPAIIVSDFSLVESYKSLFVVDSRNTI